jgi:Fe-S-cluster-containing hydrogenase component 2
VRITPECVGCGHCKVFCPVDAIETCGVSRIISDKCIECGRCKGYCAIGAITEAP